MCTTCLLALFNNIVVSSYGKSLSDFASSLSGDMKVSVVFLSLLRSSGSIQYTVNLKILQLKLVFPCQ